MARIGIIGLPFDSVAMALDSARQVAGMSGGAVPLNWRQRGIQSTGLFVSLDIRDSDQGPEVGARGLHFFVRWHSIS